MELFLELFLVSILIIHYTNILNSVSWRHWAVSAGLDWVVGAFQIFGVAICRMLRWKGLRCGRLGGWYLIRRGSVVVRGSDGGAKTRASLGVIARHFWVKVGCNGSLQGDFWWLFSAWFWGDFRVCFRGYFGVISQSGWGVFFGV